MGALNEAAAVMTAATSKMTSLRRVLREVRGAVANLPEGFRQEAEREVRTLVEAWLRGEDLPPVAASQSAAEAVARVLREHGPLKPGEITRRLSDAGKPTAYGTVYSALRQNPERFRRRRGRYEIADGKD